MALKELYNETEASMDKAINALNGDFNTIRAGRANPAVLDRIYVDYYGTATPINQLAAISVSEARILVIQPWDKSSLTNIEKAIQQSDLGIHPQNDGVVIRLTFPPLTEERRKALTKDVAKMAEDYKINIRQRRRDAIDKLKAMKKDNEVTEDDQKLGEKRIQEITDDYIKQIDELAAEKEKEIMAI
ncbi:MAG TPA: ribosome recycling factor [Clostridiales bacterium]|jgi:ribosome recycling factor|nr:ribosome recycling factor [Clostridiales bacterium]